MDDGKGGAEASERERVLRALEQRFGKLKRFLRCFENVGIVYEQNAAIDIIVSHQGNYIRQLREMSLDRISKDDATSVGADGIASYMSLLGGCAWVLMTIPAVAVYVLPAAPREGAKRQTLP